MYVHVVVLVDIVASSPLCVIDADILYHVVNLQEEFKPFLYFIRKWINDLNDVRLKKMVLLYLTIFYMQANMNILPTFNHVRSNLRKKYIQGELSF